MKDKKSIGVITMHRPISFGSSLQAYALQRKIEALGYYCEIIDYQYPNSIHYSTSRLRRLITNVVRWILNMPLGFPNLVEQYRFEKFRKNYLNLSSYYKSAEQLKQNPPEYDVYCTGSDQVWNSKFTKGDTSFLLSFVPKYKKKVSYASSFAIDFIKDEYQNSYKNYLSQYSYLSVRETGGKKIIQELIGRDAQLVCDPTILLTKEEWIPLIKKSKIKISKPYILVFMLTYSFNPYPEVNRIIEYVYKKLGYHLVFLNGRKQDFLRKDSTVIKSAGPCEFLDLIYNASFVITSSFHGVAFSVNFDKDFIAIIKNGHSDSRLLSFLDRINMTDKAVKYNTTDQLDLMNSNHNYSLQDFRNESISYLETILK